MASAAPDPPPLPLAEILRESFRMPWARRADFARALAVPALAIVVLQVGWSIAEEMPSVVLWAGRAAYFGLWVLFAVTCHRVVLLNLHGDELAWVPGWGRRETIFVVAALLAWATAIVASLAVFLVIALILRNISSDVSEAASMPITMILSTYVFARVAPVLPAAAIDAPVNLPKMWGVTRGNGWRLLVIVGALPWAFSYGVRFLGSDEAGVASVVAVTALTTLLLIVEICALSLSYRRLTPPSGRM